MGITQPVTGFYGDLLQSDLTFEVNFTVPSIIRQPHRLCYGFGIEPLKLYAQPALGIDAKYLQETTAQYAIVNVNTSVTFFSEHITGGDVGEVDPLVQDRAKWVVGKLRDQMDADTSENVLQGYDNIDCTDDPAPGTEIVPVTRDSILPLGKATFLFHVPYQRLQISHHHNRHLKTVTQIPVDIHTPVHESDEYCQRVLSCNHQLSIC